MNFDKKSKEIYELLLKAIKLLNACRIFAEKSDENTPGRSKILAMIESFDDQVETIALPDENKR